MTDGEGRLLWFGNYGGWGKFTEEASIANAHQPFWLQSQYCDGETGLHYNLSRYYDPHSGRFATRDPIRLWGGFNLYQFVLNTQKQIDILGLARNRYRGKSYGELKEIIDRLIDAKRTSSGLGTKDPKCRFEEQTYGNPPPGSTSWNNHQGNIENDQKTLNRALDAWDDGGCGPRPPGAAEQAIKPLPTAADYKGNGGPVMNGDALRTTAKTTTTIVTSVGIGYLVYRGVRMLPSLFPPLWPTIPASAAIPQQKDYSTLFLSPSDSK